MTRFRRCMILFEKLFFSGKKLQTDCRTQYSEVITQPYSVRMSHRYSGVSIKFDTEYIQIFIVTEALNVFCFWFVCFFSLFIWNRFHRTAFPIIVQISGYNKMSSSFRVLFNIYRERKWLRKTNGVLAYGIENNRDTWIAILFLTGWPMNAKTHKPNTYITNE